MEERQEQAEEFLARQTDAWGVSKQAADTFYSSVWAPSDVGITLGFEAHREKIEKDTSTNQVFCNPFFVETAGVAEKDALMRTWCEDVWLQLFKDTASVVVKKARECREAIDSPSATQLNAIGTVAVPNFPSFRPDWAKEGEVWITTPKLRAAVVVNTTETCGLQFEQWPFRFLHHVACCFSGRCVCIIMDAAKAQEVGEPHKWMLSADSTELEHCVSFFMTEGTAVNVPFGTIPIFVGLRGTANLDQKMTLAEARKHTSDKHTFTLAIVPIFDPDFVKKHYSKTHIASALAAWTMAQPSLPQTWRDDEMVKAWKVALEAECLA